ncbi:MAG TPA: ABC transporter ATP-binding protein [Firmicutes bacterium]|nr:ABC transporter ATP-binding protein [Candidatus Fermentithermobacillaceae bacterium]
MRTLRRLTQFAIPYWKVYVLTFILVFAITGMELVQPLIVRWIVDEIFGKGAWNRLLWGVLLMGAASAVAAVLGYAQRYGMSWAGQKIIFDIRNKLYEHLQQLSFSFYDKAQTGQLMSRVTADVEQTRNFLAHQIIRIVAATVRFVASIVLMLSLDWRLTLVAMVPVPLLAWRVKIYSTVIRPRFWAIQQYLAVLTATLQENITGQRVVKAFARKEHEIQKFERDNMELLNKNIDTVRASAVNEAMMMLLVESSLALILFWGGRQIIGGNMSVGTLVAFNALMLDTLRQVRMLGMWVSGVQRTIAAGDRIFEILDTKADVTDKPGAEPMPPIKGEVVFENVSFAYDGENMVLEDINLRVRPGETIAILGGTGSGKSTLINLIPRFYDTTKGRILIDGRDIRDVTLQSLRRQIGVVTQETFLFSASLRDNIAYGRPDATEEEIRRAAQAAHIDDFIDSLPNGYDTVIGERGVGLSGGQKQRVAIARALLMDARILLLDESTSSVDVETEMRIQKAFSELLRDRTSFIIAQRLSTVRNADRIIVLDKGRIVEEGTHETLLKKGGIYTAIYNLQFKSQEKEEFEREVAVAEGGER